MQAHERLEKEFAEWIGVPVEGMVACASGTAAIHLALEASELPQGSEVVTSDYSMIAVPRAITLAGMTPVFVDCGEDLLIDPDLVDEACKQGQAFDDLPPLVTHALIAVHVYGRRCRMDELMALATKHDLVVIEDLAEAHGVRPHPNSDAACWSFYKNKIIHGEEGGAVWFRCKEAADRVRQLRCLGFTANHDFRHVPRGHNYRLANCLAEKVLESLSQVKIQVVEVPVFGRRYGYGSIGKRRYIENWYNSACPAEWKMSKRDAVWVYDVRIQGLGRERMGQVVRALQAEGIEARHGFWPMHLQEEFKNCRTVKNGSPLAGWSVAELMAEEVFYLPVMPGKTTEEDCQRAFEVIGEVLG